MFNRFMISAAAAALIAGTGFANAQGTGMGREGSPAGSAVQQSQGAAPPSTTQSEEKTQRPDGKNQRAQQDMKSGPRDEKSAQDNNMKGPDSKGDKSKSMSSQNEKGSPGKDMKAEGRNGNMNADSKNPAESKSQTVGQAGAGAKISPEQRTRITSVIRNQRIESLNNVDFNIAVGTRVPRGGVHLYPLPEEVVTIYPEWRGYEFIRVRDQILVVDPRTLEIVDVIQA